MTYPYGSFQGLSTLVHRKVFMGLSGVHFVSIVFGVTYLKFPFVDGNPETKTDHVTCPRLQCWQHVPGLHLGSRLLDWSVSSIEPFSTKPGSLIR